jgi:bacteriorhodopsin
MASRTKIKIITEVYYHLYVTWLLSLPEALPKECVYGFEVFKSKVHVLGGTAKPQKSEKDGPSK